MPRVHSPELRERAIAMRRAGEKLIIISLELGVPSQTISGWLRPLFGSDRPKKRPMRVAPPSPRGAWAIDAKLEAEPRCGRCALHLPKDPRDHVCVSLPIWQSHDSGGYLVDGCSRKGQGHR